ncbi:hypothetical protein CVT24_006930 [Panaeolus cyanescens]|uniref:Phosphatidic acid phosphatase type 2/haloperoxidase domain-containing protein n=1 Tax=Panaeolus cyanescens TaxID=181874 RepID=A0A409VK66_9AGAR|nr:hypothetical protein CVT24_006930 [Panaeolus cyanescens]
MSADRNRVHFTLSIPPSEASSRSASPLPTPSEDYDINRLKSKLGALGADGAAGKDVYDTTLPWWRAAIRRRLVRAVRTESEIIAKMQKVIRTPWLDAYFVYTSSLGTHTFFMILLPSVFFFGHDEMGRGLLIVLALGVYFSSVIKDLLCSPRPFAPPVTRLTIGSHHLEYGFPSTHSTNSVSIALFFFSQVYTLAKPDPVTQLAAISPGMYHVLSAILGIYTFSIVFGRLYTAMHSFTDVAMGVTLGAGIWWAHSSFEGIPFQFALSPSNPLNYLVSFLDIGTIVSAGSESVTRVMHLGTGLALGSRCEDWIQTGGIEVPLILIPLTLFAIHVHPQPVDDCPCFEDAIAFVSVVLGALVSRWGISYGYGQAGVQRPVVVMPGSGLKYIGTASEAGLGGTGWVRVERGWEDVFVWWGMATLKMFVGILTIFVWRILAKSLLHFILPPIFRAVAKITGALPNRRFYTPATEYHSLPNELASLTSPSMSSSSSGGTSIHDAHGHVQSPGLHPIPSVIDLLGPGTIREEVGGIGSGVESISLQRPSSQSASPPAAKGPGKTSDLKMRTTTSSSSGSGSGSSSDDEKIVQRARDEENASKDERKEIKHYDADVLTKFVVYAGIAVLAAEVLPLAFDLLGWGTKSWV